MDEHAHTHAHTHTKLKFYNNKTCLTEDIDSSLNIFALIQF